MVWQGLGKGGGGCVWKYNEMQRAAGSLRRTSISSLASVFIFLCFYFLHNLNLDEGIWGLYFYQKPLFSLFQFKKKSKFRFLQLPKMQWTFLTVSIGYYPVSSSSIAWSDRSMYEDVAGLGPFWMGHKEQDYNLNIFNSGAITGTVYENSHSL